MRRGDIVVRVVVKACVTVTFPELFLPRLEERGAVGSALDIVDIFVNHFYEVLLHGELLVDFLCFLSRVNCSHLASQQQVCIESFNIFALPLLSHNLSHEPVALLILLHFLLIEHFEQITLSIELTWQHASLQLIRQLFLVPVDHENNLFKVNTDYLFHEFSI